MNCHVIYSVFDNYDDTNFWSGIEIMSVATQIKNQVVSLYFLYFKSSGDDKRPQLVNNSRKYVLYSFEGNNAR